MAEHRGYRPLEQVAPGDALEPVAKVLRELGVNVPFLHGRRVAVEFDGATATEDVEHGLGRVYEDAWVMSEPGGTRISVDPEAIADAAGVDTATYVRVKQAAATAQTVYVWVY